MDEKILEEITENLKNADIGRTHGSNRIYAAHVRHKQCCFANIGLSCCYNNPLKYRHNT